MEPGHFLSEARALSKFKKNELQGKQTDSSLKLSINFPFKKL